MCCHMVNSNYRDTFCVREGYLEGIPPLNVFRYCLDSLSMGLIVMTVAEHGDR